MLHRTALQAIVFLLVAFGSKLPLGAQQTAPAGLRTWTNTDGRTMVAKFSGIEGETAVFQMANGQEAKVPLARLSPQDREFIKNQGATGTPPAPAARVPIEKRTWPQDITVPPKSIEVKLVEDKPLEKIYRYHSEAFEFVAQDKLAESVMKEVSRVFEGTRTLVDALPWGVHPEPPRDLGFFQAKLFVTRDAYEAELKRTFGPAAPNNTGGLYFSGDRIFRVPFPSIGLVMRGKTWFMDFSRFSNDVLVHEITHQMMHDYLPFLPQWISEGCAEYTRMLPYQAGTFHAASHKRGINEYIKKQLSFATKGLAELGSPSGHMNMKPETWEEKFDSGVEAQHRIYGYSCLLVYYFCHLDGDGKGTRFLKYFDALAAESEKWREYRVQFAKYSAEMEEFYKLPGVKKREDGSFTYPQELTPPKAPASPSSRDQSAFGLDQMSILYDGRSPSQLDEDVKSGFKKVGIKW